MTLSLKWNWSCTTNHQEGTRNNDKDAESNHEVPLGSGVTLALGPVVVEPHASVELEGHQRTQKGADKRHEATEDGNAGGDEVGDDGGGESAGDPCSPVDSAVGSEMLGSSKETNKDVLGGKVNDQDGCGQKTRQRDTRSGVVSRVLHLGGDGEETRCTSVGKDERRDGRDGIGEGGVANDLPVGLPLAALGRIRGTVLDTDGDGDGEDGGHDADETEPGEHADAAKSTDTGEKETADGCDSDKDCCAGNTKDLASNATKDERARVVDTVYLRMVALKDTDHVAGPSCDCGDNDETDDTGDDSEDVKDSWDGQNTQTNLGLHHEGDSANPSDLKMLARSQLIASEM
ncbi:hypothetical protein HG531_002752 [Fusarium graminearum]|nr:hypothetical protein HG531_002752 [Fusarium graminearum]